MAVVSDALQRLSRDLTSGRIDRRSFVQGATALGISAGAATALARSAEAQSATPAASPQASPEALTFTTVSVPRDEYLKALYEQFPLDDPAGAGGHLIFTAAEDLDSVNPINRSKVVATFITGNVFSGLVDINIMDGTLVPGMADSWDAGSDGKTYRFHLNPNLRWHAASR